ncbi:O-fucosyltransferase 19 [Bienertia sinuspersici]
MLVEKIPLKFRRRKFLVKAPVSWSKANYYKWEMSRLLKKYKVVHFSHTNSRLANNGLSGSIQRLRCRAMFESLHYTDEIKSLANNFIKSLRRNKAPYIALHLRYEKDMLAFTACTHNLTTKETEELTMMRHRTRHWKEKHINGADMRQRGACPMTPREVTIFLEALGFSYDTTIYIAAGDIYGSNSLEPLRSKYPNLYDHTRLSIEDEVTPFKDHGNKLAAVDYMVAVESDVFIYSYDGHMAKAVKGHRKGFVKLIDLLDSNQVSWEEFSVKVRQLHKGRIGLPSYRQVGPTQREEENFYANPYPGCICDKSI